MVIIKKLKIQNYNLIKNKYLTMPLYEAKVKSVIHYEQNLKTISDLIKNNKNINKTIMLEEDKEISSKFRGSIKVFYIIGENKFQLEHISRLDKGLITNNNYRNIKIEYIPKINTYSITLYYEKDEILDNKTLELFQTTN